MVTGDFPAGYVWDMLVKCGDYLDIIRLVESEDGISAILTRDQLSISGRYVM